MMAEKYLIINADDYGLCAAQNEATEELLSSGAVTSATVMMPCPAAGDATLFASTHPQLGIGVHLTTTAEHAAYRWRPLCTDCTSLCDENGLLYRTSADFAQSATTEHIMTELRAQIAAFCSSGARPSHLDNHMGTLYGVATGRFELLECALQLAAEYRLPFRFPRAFSGEQYGNGMLDIRVPQELLEKVLGHARSLVDKYGVITPDYLVPGDWNGPQSESFENYREYIYELYKTFDHGVTETYIHPAKEGEQIQGITPFWQRRCWEYRLFLDPATQQHIRALGIKLIDYRALAAMRR